MITDVDANRFATHSLKNPRILRILSAALQAVDPAEAVRKHIPKISGDVYGLAIGKASIPMLTALAEALPLSGALAISKHASPLSPNLFPVVLGSHPVPDEKSLYAGQRVLEFVSSLSADDTLVCLISGGGSARVTAPCEGITLEDMQTLTSLVLSCGARIDEINTLRRQLDRIKGGGLARATKAKVISLILSDVIGNPLEAIASGPTSPNPTTNADALDILRKYQLQDQVPIAIYQYLTTSASSLAGDASAVLSIGSGSSISGAQNTIIGDNAFAAQAALEQAGREGFSAEILTNELQGEACEVGVRLAGQLREEISKRPRPFCLIAGGETTVTLRHGSQRPGAVAGGQALKGNGKGGRNQELALSTVKELAGVQDVFLITLGTDGEDGPTDAAGAVVTGESAWQAERLGVDAADHLSRNDAYAFFDTLGDLIRTGPTGTNVNDLVFLAAI